MAIRIGINGFGRIGRNICRAVFQGKVKGIEIVGVNDITSPEMLAFLLKHDSVHGAFPGSIRVAGKALHVMGKKIKVFSERDPGALPWKENKVDIVVESTGLFRKRALASKHISAGAKQVIISAPAPDPDVTIVMGVNEKAFNKKKHTVISNASCTTNCLAPIAKVLMDTFGIRKGLMTTIHSYTNDQKILDLPHSDPRRARAAALSMIPTTTGAAAAVALVLPKLKGKLDGLAIRVPTPNVSLVDLVCETIKPASVEKVQNALRKASQSKALKPYLGYTDEKLVSRDFNGNPLSSIVDGACVQVIQGKLVKVMSWYDNEWGYSNRVVDLIRYIGK